MLSDNKIDRVFSNGSRGPFLSSLSLCEKIRTADETFGTNFFFTRQDFMKGTLRRSFPPMFFLFRPKGVLCHVWAVGCSFWQATCVELCSRGEI